METGCAGLLNAIKGNDKLTELDLTGEALLLLGSPWEVLEFTQNLLRICAGICGEVISTKSCE